ncbi:MAG: hypothetical protein AAF489_07560 [Bacteroidota bacterium]
MQRQKQHTHLTFFGLLLTAVLLFPSILKLEHLVDDQEHRPCLESTVHIHESEVDCSLCLFNFSNASFEFTTIDFPIVEFVKKEVLEAKTNNLYFSNYRFIDNRGPPFSI